MYNIQLIQFYSYLFIHWTYENRFQACTEHEDREALV